ncbi:hypothetical protein [Nocardioides sp.]|uniref:hypothetical protein n=1 Tax=Nocardioides sp. TaxID=35761 RepID=UPI002732F084|nr:hypothetical protein [Nocardioides sp.]MDP3890616.1 hypothetical protein [Nocardioides sp.]
MKTLALVAALVLSLVGLASPTYADDEPPAPTVTWPDVTSFNPDLTPYTFTIDDDGGGTLFAEWRGDRVEIPHSGQVTMTFPTDGDGQILLLRCGDGACSQITDSPPLSVRTELAVGSGVPVYHSGPHARTVHSLPTGLPLNTVIDFVWEIRATTDTDDPANQVLASGSNSGGGLVFQAPFGLVSGQKYYVLADAVAHTQDFGNLAASFVVAFVYDDTATATIRASTQIIYPAQDRYLDYTTLFVKTDPDVGIRYKVSVLDKQGTVVHPNLRGYRRRHRWDGRDADRQRVPDGIYTIRVRGVDSAGNPGVDETTVKVSSKKRQMVTYKATLSAKHALVDREVGSCSTLASPSSHGGRGSLGYYSQSKCRAAARSAVETEFGIYVPKAVGGKYGDLTISFIGGAAKRAKKAYLVMYAYDAKLRKYESRFQHTAAWGRHARPKPYSGERSVVGPKGQKPAIYWYVGLSEGSRYDVQSFTVSLKYQAFI